MTGDAARGAGQGPICPSCRAPLRDALRQEQITPTTTRALEPLPAVTVVFCGSCGWTLDVVPPRLGTPGGFGPALGGTREVAAPENEESVGGQFQNRCREMITEIRSLDFEPNVWVSLINALGAFGAAKKLLADHHVLVATPWLVARGREELTLEHEIGQTRWRELFTEEERVEAANRLAACTSSS